MGSWIVVVGCLVQALVGVALGAMISGRVDALTIFLWADGAAFERWYLLAALAEVLLAVGVLLVAWGGRSVVVRSFGTTTALGCLVLAALDGVTGLQARSVFTEVTFFGTPMTRRLLMGLLVAAPVAAILVAIVGLVGTVGGLLQSSGRAGFVLGVVTAAVWAVVFWVEAVLLPMTLDGNLDLREWGGWWFQAMGPALVLQAAAFVCLAVGRTPCGPRARTPTSADPAAVHEPSTYR